MKLFYSFLIALCISSVGFSQEVLITGYFDATCPGADGRTVEIYVSGTVDLTGWELQR